MVRPENFKFKVKANPNHPAGENPVIYKGKRLIVTEDVFKIGWRLSSSPETFWIWDTNTGKKSKWYGASNGDKNSIYMDSWISQDCIPIGGIYIAIRSVTDFKYWYNYAHHKMENSRDAFMGKNQIQKFVIPVWQNCKGYLVVGMNDVFGKYGDNKGELEVEFWFINEVKLWDGTIDSLLTIMPNLKKEHIDLSIDRPPISEGSILQTYVI